MKNRAEVRASGLGLLRNVGLSDFCHHKPMEVRHETGNYGLHLIAWPNLVKQLLTEVGL